jgi:hypothetical protein
MPNLRKSFQLITNTRSPSINMSINRAGFTNTPPISNTPPNATSPFSTATNFNSHGMCSTSINEDDPNRKDRNSGTTIGSSASRDSRDSNNNINISTNTNINNAYNVNFTGSNLSSHSNGSSTVVSPHSLSPQRAPHHASSLDMSKLQQEHHRHQTQLLSPQSAALAAVRSLDLSNNNTNPYINPENFHERNNQSFVAMTRRSATDDSTTSTETNLFLNTSSLSSDATEGMHASMGSSSYNSSDAYSRRRPSRLNMQSIISPREKNIFKILILIESNVQRKVVARKFQDANESWDVQACATTDEALKKLKGCNFLYDFVVIEGDSTITLDPKSTKTLYLNPREMVYGLRTSLRRYSVIVIAIETKVNIAYCKIWYCTALLRNLHCILLSFCFCTLCTCCALKFTALCFVSMLDFPMYFHTVSHSL